MAAFRDQAARRRMELNPIHTSINAAPSYQLYSPHQTPASALSSASLSAQFGYVPSNFSTPVSSVRQYNPQQWSASPSVGSETSNHYAVRPPPLDPEVVHPAPPPYSPPRSQRTTTAAEEPSSAVSPALPASRTQAVPYRASPDPTVNSVFAPPPQSATRARNPSVDRPMNLFNFSGFGRRTGSDVPRASEGPRDQPASAITPHIRRPEPIRIVSDNYDNEQAAQSISQPPGSRRAASAGATSTPTSSRSRASSSSRWEPGMPLPPPPPPPRPSSQQSRSQSMSRTTEPVMSPPTRRPPISTLGPVPPTPANWVDTDSNDRGRSPERQVNRELQVDDSSVSSRSVQSTIVESSASNSSVLARTHAVRGESKSILERRSESRSGRRGESRSGRLADVQTDENVAGTVKPADITVPVVTGLARRPTITKSTPRTGSNRGETPKSAAQSALTATTQSSSRGSTPRPANNTTQPEQPTPPFSPNTIKGAFNNVVSPHMPPKSLPTPPPQSRTSISSPRPASHILPISNNDSAIVAPLSPSRPGSASVPNSASMPNPAEMSKFLPPDQFAQSAIERHKEFARKEAAATSDGERIRIFAEFIVAESRLRRDRYSTAIDAMGSEILDLTRDLFRPYKNGRRGSSVSRSIIWTPESSIEPASHRGSLAGALLDNAQKIQSNSEPSSSSGPVSPALPQANAQYWNDYKPSLSPIPSMSVSEAPDGSDSRGRPSSRWWEVQEGSTGIPSTRLERSKRESKYMGVPKELREALQYVDEGNEFDGPGASTQNSLEPNDYPPEKVSLKDQEAYSPALASLRTPSPTSPAQPFTPNPDHLDVSRLVTLPPPYPRHHPAVNNNHPDLASIRTTVRQLSDFTEVQATKDRFIEATAQIREEKKAAAAKRRNSLRANIQREIEIGKMTYAEAAALEASAATTEKESAKEATTQEFDHFQAQVVLPLNELIMDRVNRATAIFTQLRSKLFDDAQESSPNIPQEEGDEQPELLEKLTLLKWIFEAREQLHRELYDVLTDRNARYAEKVIAPYRLTNNEAKITHAERFFAGDALKRKETFDSDVLKRTEEFMNIIEENVVRGVEVQLSAFWDIAPSLSRIVDQIPKDQSSLHGFQVQIPSAEYEENPAYYEFPMQYLYSLLGHCGKSTYQFIESQTNLLCLLHEVKSGVTMANCKLMGSQRVLMAGGDGEEGIRVEMREMENEEEGRLTEDLKEKVRDVEELWGKGLGEELEGVRRRVRRFLEEVGGWDDEEEDGA